MTILSFFAAFVASAVASGLIVGTARFHCHISADGVSGAQKIHSGSVPRVGGVAIAIGAVIGGLFLPMAHGLWPLLAICALPAFASGLWEDLSKRVSVRTRLLATIFAGGIFAAVSGYSLHHLNLPGVDVMLGVPMVAVAFTAFAVGGIANAMNIIDGCNGLSSGTSIILFVAFGLIAHSTGDSELFALCLLCAAAIAGFLIWNFPMGKIFLGDAGAYTVGFALAAVAVALPARNAGISPVIGLLMLIYPVGETFYSMARRARRKTGAVGQPDSMHLHSLIFKALRPAVSSGVLRNSLAGATIWVLPLTSAVLAYVLRETSTGIVLLACAAHFVFYCMAYALAERGARKAAPGGAQAGRASAVLNFTLAPSAHRGAGKGANVQRDLVRNDATGT